MSASSMIERTLYLEVQPGGILPEICLKQGEQQSGYLRLIVNAQLPYAIYKRGLVLARLPDNSRLFQQGFIDSFQGKPMTSFRVNSLTKVCGDFKCTFSILDTQDWVSNKNYLDYDLITVLPFMVKVCERA